MAPFSTEFSKKKQGWADRKGHLGGTQGLNTGDGGRSPGLTNDVRDAVTRSKKNRKYDAELNQRYNQQDQSYAGEGNRKAFFSSSRMKIRLSSLLMQHGGEDQYPEKSPYGRPKTRGDLRAPTNMHLSKWHLGDARGDEAWEENLG